MQHPILSFPDREDFKIHDGTGYLSLANETPDGNKVIGFELEYAYNASPEASRTILNMLLNMGYNEIDSYRDINRCVVQFLKTNLPFFLLDIHEEHSPMGVELVTRPMTKQAAYKVSWYLELLINFLENLDYSPTKGSPGMHVNLGQGYSIENLCINALNNYSDVNWLSGRVGVYQSQSDIPSLLGDSFYETDLHEFIVEDSLEFKYKAKDRRAASLMGIYGKPTKDGGYRYEITWYATPSTALEFLERMEFTLCLCELDAEMEMEVLDYIEANEDSYPYLYEYIFL